MFEGNLTSGVCGCHILAWCFNHCNEITKPSISTFLLNNTAESSCDSLPPLHHPADRVVERFWLQKECLPWAAAWLLSPSFPAAGATKARCYVAPPPSVPPLSLPGGWCPERRMTNASASSYWRIWTTWLQPRTVPTASTRCWLNGRGLAVDAPICVCIGKIWQGGVSVYPCVSVCSIGLCTCVCVCLFT